MKPEHDPRALVAMEGLFWIAFVLTAIGMYAHKTAGWLP